jgi:hypothetical protein
MKFSSFDSETDENHTNSNEAGVLTDHFYIIRPLTYVSDNKKLYEELRNTDYIFTSGKKFYLCQLT